MAVGEGQAFDETLATGAAGAMLSWCFAAGSDGCASLMHGEQHQLSQCSPLLAQPGC